MTTQASDLNPKIIAVFSFCLGVFFGIGPIWFAVGVVVHTWKILIPTAIVVLIVLPLLIKIAANGVRTALGKPKLPLLTELSPHDALSNKVHGTAVLAGIFTGASLFWGYLVFSGAA